MTRADTNNFSVETECTYKNEQYSVRDNGSVFRHPRAGKRSRPTDSKWTFGKKNVKTGYMEIASVRIHRIVATAFHGKPPTSEHVVDHIDTNRCNNRPENLRWLTRLENALKNPITRKRIEFLCGSIDAFIEDPSILGRSSLDPNFQWMRTVTSEEAKVCRERLELWAESDQEPSGGSLGEWIYKPLKTSNQFIKSVQPVPPRDLSTPLVKAAQVMHSFADLVMSKTEGAAQRDWRIPSEFPCCPQKETDDPIAAYVKKLKKGKIFASNHVSETEIVDFALSEDKRSILVICEQKKSGVKPWSLAEISYEGGLYIHRSSGTFFDRQGAEKYFTIKQGLKWDGGDTIDDFC